MAETEDRCVHELLAGQCADCSGRDGGEADAKERRRALLRAVGVVAAGWPGRCAACGDPYGKGTPIRFSGQAAGWVADCCLTDLMPDPTRYGNG